MEFVDSNGRCADPAELQSACNSVADDWLCMAVNIYLLDAYPAHVSESVKYKRYLNDVHTAEQIRSGMDLHNFTVRQRVNTYLTGNCVPLLSK